MAQQPLEIRSSNSPALTPASCCKKELGAWRWKKRDRLAGAGVSGKTSREKCSLGFVQTGSKIIETEAQHSKSMVMGRGMLCMEGSGETDLAMAKSLWGRSWRVQRARLRDLGFIPCIQETLTVPVLSISSHLSFRDLF